MDRIDFNLIWPNFKRHTFALYDDKNDRIIDKDDKILGNTDIKYYEEYIAIWYLDESILHNNFVGLKDSKGKVLMLKERVITKLKEGSLNQVERVYRLK